MGGPGLTILLGLLVSAFQLELVAAGALGPGSNADWVFCSPSNQCEIGGGDCDNNSDCKEGLICGEDNCKTWHPQAHQAADCCMEDPNAKKCPDGWTKHEDACYLVVKERKTWDDANKNCQQKMPGAQLTSVHSDAKNRFLINLVGNTIYVSTSIWLGGSRPYLPKNKPWSYSWTDGSEWCFTKWAHGEHTTKTKYPWRRCAVSRNHHGGNPVDPRWAEVYCGNKIASVCEYRLNAEKPGCSSETKSGPECPEYWSRYEDRCYLVQEKRQTRDKAWHDCIVNHSRLTSVHSDGEYEFLQRLVGTTGEPFWTGGHRLSDYPDLPQFRNKTRWIWKWDDGTDWNYSKWGNGKPDDANGLEFNVLGTSGSDKLWDDANKDLKFKSVCKRRPVQKKN